MKILRLLGATFAIFVMTTASSIGLNETPIEFRLNRLADSLQRFAAAAPSDSVIASHLMKRGTGYVLKWVHPSNPKVISSKNPTQESIITTAVRLLGTQLPTGLRPERSNLIAIGKYQISEREGPAIWIWVTEFKIHDETPMGGSGYPETLFVPMDMGGKLLLTVQPWDANSQNRSD